MCLCREHRNEIPVNHVGLLSFLFYSWLDPIMWRMFRDPNYDPVDLCSCPDLEKAAINADRYEYIIIIIIVIRHHNHHQGRKLEQKSGRAPFSPFPLPFISPPLPPSFPLLSFSSSFPLPLLSPSLPPFPFPPCPPLRSRPILWLGAKRFLVHFRLFNGPPVTIF